MAFRLFSCYKEVTLDPVTVKGDDLILSCRNCFSKHAYAVKLEQNGNGGTFDCPLCGLKYVVKNGLLEEFDGDGA